MTLENERLLFPGMDMTVKPLISSGRLQFAFQAVVESAMNRPDWPTGIRVSGTISEPEMSTTCDQATDPPSTAARTAVSEIRCCHVLHC
jgi:hypothetical protein